MNPLKKQKGLYNLSYNEAIRIANSFNQVHSFEQLKQLASRIEIINHPLPKQLLGFNFFTRGYEEDAKKYLIDSVRIGLSNYSFNEHMFFIDSFASSLSLLLNSNKSVFGKNPQLYLKAVSTCYFNLSKAISVLPVAFDTYRNRALLIQMNEAIFTEIIFKYCGLGIIADGFIVCDYYRAYIESSKVGANEQARRNYSDMNNLVDHLSGLRIAGKDIEDWDMKYLTKLIMEREEQIFHGLQNDYYTDCHLTPEEFEELWK